jgi:hypothetical protein
MTGKVKIIKRFKRSESKVKTEPGENLKQKIQSSKFSHHPPFSF